MADSHDDPAEHERPRALRWTTRALEELGIVAVYETTWDAKLLILQRFVRFLAYGGSTLILANFMTELGVSETRTGLFMTLTLVGDVLISLCLTLVADAVGRRAILALGAVLMTASGIVFSLSTNYWVLLVAAIVGVITPSGNEIGPFRAVEESVIAHLTDSKSRASVFAWYTLVGNLGSAVGILSCGWTTTVLIERRHWTLLETYQLIFTVYAVLGLVKFVLSLVLSKKCELDPPPPDPITAGEQAPLLANGGDPTPAAADAPAPAPKRPKESSKILSVLPRFSPESKIILIQLCLLMGLDSFASGLAPLSWTTYYFKSHFGLPESDIGDLFFVCSLVSAASVLVAASIAKRIGNVRTMVFTHLPSAVALALIGIPAQQSLAMLFVFLRACSQSMDTAPRSAFLSAIVLPPERTATMGMVNVVKTVSQSLGPFITGVLADHGLFWVAFLTAGCLKATYDIGMLLVFAGTRSREERERDAELAAAERERVERDGGSPS